VMDLVRDSDYLTVLFLTDGSGKFSGTPFDKEINDSFAAWKAEEEKKQMPFLTILRANKGAFTHHAVVPLPWNWEMPPLPPDLVAAWNTTKKQIEALTNKPVAAVGQPLIVKGKKPDAPPVNQIATNTPPLTISNAAPAHTAVTIPQTTATTNQLTARAPLAATTTTKPPTLSENPPSAAPASSPVTAVPATTRTESPTAAKASTEGNRHLTSAATTGIEPPPASSLQLAQADTKPAPPPTTANAPESPASKPTAKPVRDETAAVTPQQGALVPPPTIWENEWFWVGIGIVTLVTVVVTFSVVRRSRPHSRISLITSSYDRTNKP
jgi:hypothetical protein